MMRRSNVRPPFRGLALAALGALCLVFPDLPAAAEIRVEHITATHVYVDAGRAEGLRVGDRLRVVDAAGRALGELEVAYVAEHSSSCRRVGDSPLPEPGMEVVPFARREVELDAEEISPSPLRVQVGPGSDGRPSPRPRSSSPRQPWARASGSVSVGFQQFRNGADFGSDLRESTGRIDLRLRDIGRQPMALRLRARVRESRRGDRPAERRDRLYEASFAWAPPEGRFHLLGGRIGASPFRGIGTLDGAVASYRPLPGLAIGAFFGSRPEVRDLGFDSLGTSYGAYARLSRRTPTGFVAEAVVGGVGAYDPDGLVSREYVVLETRLGGGSRWSLFQTAELDLDRSWDDAAIAQPSQLSLFSLSGSLRLAEHLRVLLSYDRRQPYRDAETRHLPETVFDTFVRQGFRVGLHFGDARRWTGSVSIGQRSIEAGDSVTSVVLTSHLHRFLGSRFSFGLDASGYRGDLVEGAQLRLRARRTFRGGHEIGLLLGTSQTSLLATGEDRANHWARLEGLWELPASFFLRAGVEANAGDDLEGQRYLVELGYRF